PSVEDSSLDFNDQFTKAHCLMEMSDASLFLTGKAGTGKSTLLTYFRKTTKKKVVFLAPTGVAAVHIKGQTIHSFFKFKPNVTLQSIRSQRLSDAKNIYKKLDTLVIDEVSMVRADLMDCIDKFLRLNGKDANKPFGGIQMIFIGDLYQLPPVINSQDKQIFNTLYESPYFFSAHFFKDFEMELIELEKIYRQKDTDFIQILNAIRNNSVTQEQLDVLNRQHDPNYVPPENPFFISLTPTNKRAQQINQERLSALKNESSLFEAEISGTFGKESYPCPLELDLKPGAQIMMNNNDVKGRWINGTMGKVVRIEESSDPELPTNVVVRLENGRHVYVTPNKWEIYKIFLEEGEIES
ncbi:MAG: AAA family ATPase, partial [bacterium]|nr:AAA family ATPase [bacterium]